MVKVGLFEFLVRNYDFFMVWLESCHRYTPALDFVVLLDSLLKFLINTRIILYFGTGLKVLLDLADLLVLTS